MATGDRELERSFTFNPLPSKKPPFLGDRATLALLMKWSMLGRIAVQSYSFDRNFRPYNSDTFAQNMDRKENLDHNNILYDFQCFFRDPVVLSSLAGMSKLSNAAPLDEPAVSVDVQPVPCTRVSMELFDPLYSCGVVRPTGDLVKCFHNVYPDYDELRQMLQEEESENYYAVGRAERDEFLFRLFKHLCLGGELCQYEDTVEPYISTTRRIYKDLISVQKDPETKEISVVSTVLKVFARDESGRCFPERPEEEQTFAYLIIDPHKRHVTLFSHIYGIGDLEL